MNFKSGINMTGSLTIKQYDLDGKLIKDLTVPNLVVTAGKEYVANRIVRNDMTPMSHMAIGQSTTTSAASQTDLISRAQTVTTTTTLNGTSITYSASFPASSAISIQEAGIFNALANKAVSFDGNLGITASSSSITAMTPLTTVTSPATHSFVTGDQVRYTSSGGSSVGGLSDGNIYYIINSSTTAIKLATTSANASAGTAIAITSGTGTGHKLTAGTMMCRTTFPAVTKGVNDTVVISWTVTVG